MGHCHVPKLMIALTLAFLVKPESYITRAVEELHIAPLGIQESNHKEVVLPSPTRVEVFHPNSVKSTIFLTGVEPSIQTEIVDCLGYQLGALPMRYLGVPLISTKLKATDCHALEDRILQRIKTWTNRFLSFAGRLQLIQSVLFSIQAYWSYHFVLPSKVAKSIESTLSAFLWNGVSIVKLSLAAMVYSLWKERNRRKHDNVCLDELSLIRGVKHAVRLRLMSGSGFPVNAQNLHLLQRWNLPHTIFKT